MDSEAKDNAGVQMLDSGMSGKTDSKKKYIIGGVVGVILIVALILGVTLTKGSSSDDGTPDDGVNPMLAIFASEPDFTLYKKNDKGTLFTQNLWNQPNYGGPIQESIRRSQDEGGEQIVIDNGLTERLYENYKSKGSLHGLFHIKNVKNGNDFYNIDIFADNIDSQEQMDKLQLAHDTPDTTKDIGDLKDVIYGYVRIIIFEPFGTVPDDPTTIDPSQAENNELKEVFEGYYENMSSNANYGRWMTGNGLSCYLGYFSFDPQHLDWAYKFSGKGLHY